MATTPPPAPTPATGGIIDRIKNILLSPKPEWDRIDAEPMTEKGIFTGWVLPLAAIGPVAGLIGSQLFGYGYGVVFKPSLLGSLSFAIVCYVLAVIGVWVLAKIVDWLAPNFGGTRNPVSALKVVAFSYTASFVGGIFGLVPMLGILGVLFGLYSLYLLYLGLPRLMKAPQDKALGYTVVTILCAIVLYIVIGAIATTATASFMGPAMLGGATTAGSVELPGGGSVDLGKLETAAKQMEANANAAQAAAAAGAAGAATVKPIDPNALQALLPTAAAGWNRTAIESASAGAAGVAGSNAKGDYSRGDDTAQLSVTDMGAMGGLAALGSAFNVQANRTTETGFEKTGQVDGRMTTEKWDSGSRHGEYSTVVANRFVVSVEGEADSLDTLKALAATVNLGTLEGMAK
ncbi:YIP1 family protein [Sphingomonas cannabina]|uniref:Yip1 family protein n=1 Tax=Sphingomonas cannabina TaxID=2899123 RepID=UPI001F20FE5D|nr:Yip1 family protein [Sphingomonas cannabina]UIJ45067.1 YIP1 family protein [Sphingomonas cannabina]